MAPKVDSLNIISNTKPLSVASSPKNNCNIEVFENNISKANVDEIAISTANSNINSDKKSDNKKKWLIGAGIALGATAIATCFLLKKSNVNICVKGKLKTLEEYENIDFQMIKPVFKERRTSYRHIESTPIEAFTPLLNNEIKNLGMSTYPGYGNTCLKGAQNIPLGTSGLVSCAAIFMYNTKQKTHALYHATTADKKEFITKNILKIMPEGFDKIIIVPGSDQNTAITVKNLFDSAKTINPKALVEFKHSQTHLEKNFLSRFLKKEVPLAIEFISYKGNVYEYPINEYIRTNYNIFLKPTFNNVTDYISGGWPYNNKIINKS